MITHYSDVQVVVLCGENGRSLQWVFVEADVELLRAGNDLHLVCAGGHEVIDVHRLLCLLLAVYGKCRDVHLVVHEGVVVDDDQVVRVEQKELLNFIQRGQHIVHVGLTSLIHIYFVLELKNNKVWVDLHVHDCVDDRKLKLIGT